MLRAIKISTACVVLVSVLGGTTGCTEFWTSTISKKRAMESGDVMFTTADLRQTTRTLHPGGVITCAEPSPDIAKIASAAFNASGSGSANATAETISPAIAASLAASRSEALAQIGRIATVTLLRDGMYRACEAYANGAIDKSAYSAILSRYDKLMITMLLGEFAANSTTRILPVALAGNSQANGNANANSGGGTQSAGTQVSTGTQGDGTQASGTQDGGTQGQGEASGDAAATSQAQSATTAPALAVLEESGDRTGIAAALATMQQAYIDDLNVDPVLLNCLRSDLSPEARALCGEMAKESQLITKLVDAKVLSVLMRAKDENDTTPTDETVKEIKALQDELEKLKKK